MSNIFLKHLVPTLLNEEKLELSKLFANVIRVIIIITFKVTTEYEDEINMTIYHKILGSVFILILKTFWES